MPKIAASLNVYAYVHIAMSNMFICMYFWPIEMTGKLCIPQSWPEYGKNFKILPPPDGNATLVYLANGQVLAGRLFCLIVVV